MRAFLLAATISALACGAPRVIGPSSPPRVYAPDDWGPCADAADPCCVSVAQMDAARGRGDDRTADEQLERLALNCPERTKGVLARWAKEDRVRCPQDLAATIQFGRDYRIRISPADRIVWAATYFDRTRPRWYAPSGARELVVEVDVVSGEPPDVGKPIRLRDTQPLALGPGEKGTIVVELARQPGPAPFRLDVQLESKPEKLGFTVCPRREGTVGLGRFARESTRTPSVAPPPFEPPHELRDAGAPWGRGATCDRSERGSTVYLIGIEHPRRAGAALDWLRRFEYESRPRGSCEYFNFDFASGAPAPR
jgi:hypothetical protein